MNQAYQASFYFGTWIDAKKQLPGPGDTVLLVYQREDGTPSEPILSVPVLADGTRLYEDARFTRPPLWWLPFPPPPGNPGGRT